MKQRLIQLANVDHQATTELWLKRDEPPQVIDATLHRLCQKSTEVTNVA